MTRSGNTVNGVLLLDKPTGITSHDAVQQIRRLVGQRRVGHTGTLDPAADGLLVICLGSAAKVARFISDMDKSYQGTICLGRTSKTYDAEGVDHDVPAAELPDLSVEKLEAVLAEFEGKIIQRVPAFSAVRVDGQRLHELAREGVDVEPPEREVVIKNIQLKEFDSPYVSIEVTCTKGTYIRSLAHDLGQKLGCGAYLSQLRRTAVGHLSIDRAVTLEGLADLVNQKGLDGRLLQPHEALGYSALLVDNGFRELVINGRELQASNVASIEGSFAAGDTILLKDSRGMALAVGVAEIDSSRVLEMHEDNKLFKYVRVLN